VYWDYSPLVAMYDIIPDEPYSFRILFSKELTLETESAIPEFILPSFTALNSSQHE